MFTYDNLHNIEYLAAKEIVQADILIRKCGEGDSDIVKMLENKKIPYQDILDRVRKM